MSTYIIGFCDSLRDALQEFLPNFHGIVSETDKLEHFVFAQPKLSRKQVFDCPAVTFFCTRLHDIRLIGSVTLVVILALTIVGMEWVTRVQKLLLALLVFAQFDFIIGTFLPPSPAKLVRGFTGWNATVASQNLWSQYTQTEVGTTSTVSTVCHWDI